MTKLCIFIPVWMTLTAWHRVPVSQVSHTFINQFLSNLYWREKWLKSEFLYQFEWPWQPDIVVLFVRSARRSPTNFWLVPMRDMTKLSIFIPLWMTLRAWQSDIVPMRDMTKFYVFIPHWMTVTAWQSDIVVLFPRSATGSSTNFFLTCTYERHE